ncbi:MAG TPA: cyclic 2,3-diphosphoglycerate synthase [Vicinamibacteria bacterium]|nr:cyclic 2,3-diphosphoglycerate synthase [Vicinamibacteria bacterium]
MSERQTTDKRRVLILGAAGRDFHDFNTCFRNDPRFEVVAFTAAQIPDIVGRRYPPSLGGELYPDGIPIHSEDELETLITQRHVRQCVLSYSDLRHDEVMTIASRVLASGADFALLGPESTMLHSNRPVVAVCAVRTGCGKSQTCRYVADVLRASDLQVVVVRHPMPYGDLDQMRVQRFATMEDLDAEGDNITIEEREEYEPHIAEGTIVYAGVDYGEILARAEEEADVIMWDGGNNDLPFFNPSLWITLADPHRAGHELAYHPGETNFRSADIILINKAENAPPGAVEIIRGNAAKVNPHAKVICARSKVTAEHPERIRGKRVLLIEDGPTLTHGGMPYGAGKVAAEQYGAAEIVDPRPHALGSLKDVFSRFPHLTLELPAMGYYPEQIEELERTIAAVDCDTVVVATPIDLRHLIDIRQDSTRIRYDLEDLPGPTLRGEIEAFVANL